MNKKTVRDLNVFGKRMRSRAGCNVSLENGAISLEGRELPEVAALQEK